MVSGNQLVGDSIDAQGGVSCPTPRLESLDRMPPAFARNFRSMPHVAARRFLDDGLAPTPIRAVSTRMCCEQVTQAPRDRRRRVRSSSVTRRHLRPADSPAPQRARRRWHRHLRLGPAATSQASADKQHAAVCGTDPWTARHVLRRTLPSAQPSDMVRPQAARANRRQHRDAARRRACRRASSRCSSWQRRTASGPTPMPTARKISPTATTSSASTITRRSGAPPTPAPASRPATRGRPATSAASATSPARRPTAAGSRAPQRGTCRSISTSRPPQHAALLSRRTTPLCVRAATSCLSQASPHL